MIQTTEALAASVPVTRACEALGYPRSSLYRSRQPRSTRKQRARPTSARALSVSEKAKVRDLLNSERFQDSSPHQVYATLLDEGTYHCSITAILKVKSKGLHARGR